MQKTHYVYCINKGCDGWSELDFFKDVSLKLQTSCYGKVLMCIYNMWHWENVSGYRCNKLFQAHTSEASHVYHMVDCCLSLLFIHFMPRFGLAIANSDCLPSFQMWLWLLLSEAVLNLSFCQLPLHLGVNLIEPASYRHTDRPIKWVGIKHSVFHNACHK